MDITINRTMSSEAIEALDAALRALNDKVFGVSQRKDVLVVHVESATAEEQDAIVDAVLAHDPTTRTPRQQKEANAITKRAAAEGSAENIPGWATWDEQQATDWITNNVTDLASAKTALLAITRMVVALRDAQWPNLGQ